jgi:hypothetical protein
VGQHDRSARRHSRRNANAFETLHDLFTKSGFDEPAQGLDGRLFILAIG